MEAKVQTRMGLCRARSSWSSAWGDSQPSGRRRVSEGTGEEVSPGHPGRGLHPGRSLSWRGQQEHWPQARLQPAWLGL